MVAAVLALAVAFGTPGPIHRHSAADLIAFRDRTNQSCGTTYGPAQVDWIAGRVNFPSGTPYPLSQAEQEMLGSGPKIACVNQAIH